MTIEDIIEYKKNAVELLKKHDRYATAKAVEEAFVSLACLGQYMWERDVAISQLEELGLNLGQKVDGMKVVNLDELAESIENKMTYMCGCRNCIETVTKIIKGEIKPFDSQCDKCGNKDCESKNSN
jgi:hypothetical protein